MLNLGITEKENFMDLNEAEQLCKELMEKNEVKDFGFEWNPWLTSSLGRCNYAKKVIELNPAFVRENDRWNVRQVILHEIAHAMTWIGYKRGLYNKSELHHSRTFKRLFFMIGGSQKHQYKCTAKLKQYRRA